MLFSSVNIGVSADKSNITELAIRAFRFFKCNQEFDQYVDIDYDDSFINKRLKMEETLNVPIMLTYWTNVYKSIKDWILPVPFFFKNKVIYGLALPQQFIRLNITSKPFWLNCNFTKDVIPIGVPTINDSKFSKDKEFSILNATIKDKLRASTSLILSPLIDAPAQQYSIGIEICLPPMGMIRGSTFRKNITFTPSFFPKIDIEIEKPVRLISPQNSVNFPITVTNTANKKIRVFPKLLDNSKNNIGTINPANFTIYPGETAEVVYSIFTNLEAGWHDTSHDITIDFFIALAPFSTNQTYGSYPVTLTLNTYGFSTPGFNMSIISIAAIIFIFMYKKRGGCAK